jgi:hypothetical protein
MNEDHECLLEYKQTLRYAHCYDDDDDIKA